MDREGSWESRIYHKAHSHSKTDVLSLMFSSFVTEVITYEDEDSLRALSTSKRDE